MRLLTLLVAGLLVVASCGPKTVAPGPWPIQPPDTSECSTMCKHLQALKCEEGLDLYNSDLPGPKGVANQTCADWCEEVQGRGMFQNPRCVKTVPSCDLIEEYRKKTCTN